MKNLETSLWKIQNKPMFYLIVVLYFVPMFLNSSNLISTEIYKIYSFVFFGFCIGSVVTAAILQPKSLKVNYKHLLMLIVVLMLVSFIVFY